MRDLIKDIVYGARTLLRNPAMTITVVLTMALGVGANTAVFSGVNQIFLNPTPGVERSSELVELYVTDATRGNLDSSYPEYRDYRDRNEVFTGLLAYTMFLMHLAEEESSERVFTVLASGNYFDVLGVPAAHGRMLDPADDTVDGRLVVVISHGLWQRRFGGRPDVVGKTISLNSQNFTIVGVAQPEFKGTFPGLAFDAWLPLANRDYLTAGQRSEDRNLRWLSVIGRLKEDVGIPQAAERLNLIAADLARTHPQTNAGLTVSIYPQWRSPRGAPALLGSLVIVLMGVMGLLLVVTCANVANLLLSRAVTRQRDIAIHLALGASRGRLVRQLLIESMQLALLSGVAGVVVGYWTAIWMGDFLPITEIPVNREVRLDPGVLAFAFAVTAVSGLLFGLVPALRATRPELMRSLKNDTAAAVGGPGRSRLRSSLVVVQIALSLVLLVAAGLFLRSLIDAQAVNTGFNPRNVLLNTMFMPGYDEFRGTQFYRELIERIDVVPEVQAAGLIRRVPLGLGGLPSANIGIEGYPQTAGERPWSYVNFASPGLFETLEVPIVAGREFTLQDTRDTARVAVINRMLASQYFQGLDPIGRRMEIDGQAYSIVGVAGDFRVRQLNEDPVPLVFLPVMQVYRPDLTLMVRTAGDPSRVATAVRSIVHDMDPQIQLVAVRTLERHIETATFPQRASASFLSLFAVLALLLAAVGIYGVMAYSIAQRTREIGIRVALGAQRFDILRLLLKEGVKLTVIGVAFGLFGAFAVSRLLGEFLLQARAGDGLIFTVVTVLLALVALIACYLPARRALRVDPVVALRHD